MMQVAEQKLRGEAFAKYVAECMRGICIELTHTCEPNEVRTRLVLQIMQYSVLLIEGHTTDEDLPPESYEIYH